MSDNLIDNVQKMDEMEKETIKSLGSGFKAFQNRNPNYILVSKNTMGENISFTGSMTLESFGKNIKFAMQLIDFWMQHPNSQCMENKYR